MHRVAGAAGGVSVGQDIKALLSASTLDFKDKAVWSNTGTRLSSVSGL
jgi:hypothetical protein